MCQVPTGSQPTNGGSEWPVAQVTEEGVFPQKLPQRTLARLPSVPMRASGVHVPHLHQEQGRMGGVRAAQGGGDPERVRFFPVSADTFVRVRLGVGSSGPWGKR